MTAENKITAISREIKQGASVDELAQRIMESGVVKEDTANFIALNWQKFAGLIVLAILFVFLFNQYNTTQTQRSYDASQRLDSVAENFNKYLVDDADTKKTEDNKDLNLMLENVKAIETTHSDLSYAKFALLYKVAADIKSKNFDSANSDLIKFDTTGLLSVSLPKKSSEVEKNDILQELAALMKIRLLIAEGKQEPLLINQNLRSLIYGSRFVNIEAILLLNRIASANPEAIAFTKETTDQILSVRPEMKEILNTSLTQEGYNNQ